MSDFQALATKSSLTILLGKQISNNHRFSLTLTLHFMKTFQLMTLAGISLLAMSSSCTKKDEACPSSPVVTTPVSGLIACFGTPLAEIGQSDQYVINSLAEYKSTFPCSVIPPVIDFKANTLLAGRTKTASGSFITSQHVRLTCSGEYRYCVKLGRGVTQAIEETAYYTLVPKLPSNAKVTFDVQRD